jgi:hypothetical protein
MSCATADGTVHAAVVFNKMCWPLCEVLAGTQRLNNRKRQTGYPRHQHARFGTLTSQILTCTSCAALASTDQVIAMDFCNLRRKVHVAPLTYLRWERKGKLTFTALRHPGTSRRMLTQHQLDEVKAMAAKSSATGARRGEILSRAADKQMKALGLTDDLLCSVITVTHAGVTHALQRYEDWISKDPVMPNMKSNLTRWGGWTICSMPVKITSRLTRYSMLPTSTNDVDCVQCVVARDTRRIE